MNPTLKLAFIKAESSRMVSTTQVTSPCGCYTGDIIGERKYHARNPIETYEVMVTYTCPDTDEEYSTFKRLDRMDGETGSTFLARARSAAHELAHEAYTDAQEDETMNEPTLKLTPVEKNITSTTPYWFRIGSSCACYAGKAVAIMGYGAMSDKVDYFDVYLGYTPDDGGGITYAEKQRVRCKRFDCPSDMQDRVNEAVQAMAARCKAQADMERRTTKTPDNTALAKAIELLSSAMNEDLDTIRAAKIDEAVRRLQTRSTT